MTEEAAAREGVPFRAGTVALIGRPNVGKSTLMNAVLGVKLSIVSHRPQTTRNRILGVHTVEGQGQIVFVDTPGIHDGRKRLNRAMVEAARESSRETDVIAFVVDAASLLKREGEPLWGEDLAILEELTASGVPIVLVINKVDRVRPRERLLPAMEALASREGIRTVVPVSALREDNLDRLVRVLVEALPEGDALYPSDMLTDRAERFFAGEMVREQILRQTEEEVPYSVAIEVEEFGDYPEALEIGVVIHVERDSQKAILIGRAGSRLKEIGTRARAELEQFFGRKVRLRTFVKVADNWREDPRSLQRFGYEGESL